ncbi:MAG: flagellar basal-body rod protein FlgF [Myxococcota bacterium]
MSDGIWAAVSGAVAQQRALDVTANNVANANTTGFRADRVAFREALAEAGEGPAPADLRLVGVAQVEASEAPGAIGRTDGNLDFAIEGDGLFTVQTPQGERYTRAGQFHLDAEGVLRTASGAAVLGWVAEAGGATQELRIPPASGEIRVGEDGTIRAGDQEVGRLALRSFDEGQLEKEGNTLFVANGAGDAAEARVLQGYLEGSNMNAVAGMNELITVSRSFEAFQKVIDTFQRLDDRTARDLAKRG